MRRTGLDDDFNRYMSRVYGLQSLFDLNDDERDLMVKLAEYRAGRSILKNHEALDAIALSMQGGRSIQDLAIIWGMAKELRTD